MAQMKEQIKTPEKAKEKGERQPFWYGAQNTGNQDAHRNSWVWLQNRGESDTVQSEIKKNTQGTNTDGKEIRTQINDLEQKEEINIQPEQNEETRI